MKLLQSYIVLPISPLWQLKKKKKHIYKTYKLQSSIVALSTFKLIFTHTPITTSFRNVQLTKSLNLFVARIWNLKFSRAPLPSIEGVYVNPSISAACLGIEEV